MSNQRLSSGRMSLEPLLSAKLRKVPQQHDDMQRVMIEQSQLRLCVSPTSTMKTLFEHHDAIVELDTDFNSTAGSNTLQPRLRSSFSAPYKKKLIADMALTSRSFVIDASSKPRRSTPTTSPSQRARSNSLQSGTIHNRTASPLHLHNSVAHSRIRSISLSKSMDASLPSIDSKRRAQSYSDKSMPKVSRLKKKTRSSLPQIPGLPKVTRKRSDFFSYSDLKPLHTRSTISNHAKRVPPEKIFKLIKREPSGAIVIRVGGGYVVVSDDWDAFFSHGILQRASDNKDFVPDGVKVKMQLKDGTLVLDDGTMIRPDGTRVFENGLQLMPDGTWVDADGNIITDESKLAELNSTYADAVAHSRAASRRGSMMGNDFAKFRRKASDGDIGNNEYNNKNRLRKASLDDTNDRNGQNTNDADSNGSQDGETKETKESIRKRLGLENGWDFDNEVIEILPDGSRVLADGTIINVDGTITLADGTVLSKEEAAKLTRKRKGQKEWPKKLQKNGDASSTSSTPNGSNFGSGTHLSLDGIVNSLSSSSSRHHSRQNSNLPDTDNLETEIEGNGFHQRLRFPKSDPYGYFAEDVMGQMKPGPGVCALDYLSRYCILPAEHLQRYRQVFDSLDSDHDGEISKIELEFGIKTVNKHFISHKEMDYVDVVLDIQRARSINFRMFALISALSERVVGLDVFVKNIVNAIDARALARKILGTKDLFYILDEKMRGVIGVDDMSNELVAGRISKEHETVIIDKFTEDGKDDVGFMDFLTYIPLFLEIHDTINDNPFETKRDK
eukprot:m.115841 g.115841  ORF g.115841 m.115841 type:complete len:785 (+) comp9295_c0_seq13:121-2475(+)